MKAAHRGWLSERPEDVPASACRPPEEAGRRRATDTSRWWAPRLVAVFATLLAATTLAALARVKINNTIALAARGRVGEDSGGAHEASTKWRAFATTYNFKRQQPMLRLHTRQMARCLGP
mmetsp:Transcript_37808/g.55540  ORF Transcript_37808/g.55540 Transcript_37808/m.55540 type:complete len:120 (-) Transcript_37808:20-379(-)